MALPSSPKSMPRGKLYANIPRQTNNAAMATKAVDSSAGCVLITLELKIADGSMARGCIPPRKSPVVEFCLSTTGCQFERQAANLVQIVREFHGHRHMLEMNQGEHQRAP